MDNAMNKNRHSETEKEGMPFNIMVVDDKPANLRLLEKMLTEKGYDVRPFPRGKMAINAAFSDPPDLFLLDINMPEMDGFEVCTKLKENAVTKDIPVIFISALTETDDKINALEAGGVDYITKPFQFEEVHARVKTHLNLRRAQKKLADKNQELEKVLSDLHAAQDKLVQSEKMAALGVLTAGIAHEINNPVNFIKTSALGLGQDVEDFQKLFFLYREYCKAHLDENLIEELNRQEEAVDYDTVAQEIPDLIRNIQEGVRRTEDIVNSLRLFSRQDDVATTEKDIHELIDATLTILKNRCRPLISIRKNYGTLPKVQVHPGQLIQVFTNIIANAIDAILSKPRPDTETIAIETDTHVKDEKTFGRIRISDTGPGIPENIRDKIFDPFFTTKDVGKGTGLGLSISMGIIRDHGGQIEVTTSPEKGACFSILLPV